jgi:hypothetical protein
MERGRKKHVPLRGIESPNTVLIYAPLLSLLAVPGTFSTFLKFRRLRGPRAGNHSGSGGVDALDESSEPDVGFIAAQAKVSAKAVDLVDNKKGNQLGLIRLAQYAVRPGAHPLNRVDDKERTVAREKGRGDLSAEVDVAR